ncbi:hypothetical protein B566_EDAN005496 [Ephemera danica]|nr:hypothetical protein B566_EDAN005496 [Ephemera danica]
MVSPVREVEPRITITGLGNPIRPTTQLTSEKFNSSVFSRLGNKPMAAVAASATYHDEVEEQPKLKYAGVLKKPATAPTTLSLGPIKKKMIKTIIKKRVPISGTMRSDLQEPGVQQRLGVSSTTTVAKVLPIKKNIISLKKPQPPVRSSVATIKPGQGDMRYRVKNRISSTVTNSSFSTNKKVVTSRIQAVTSTSSKYGKDSGNVFARLGR